MSEGLYHTHTKQDLTAVSYFFNRVIKAIWLFLQPEITEIQDHRNFVYIIRSSYGDSVKLNYYRAISVK